MTNPNSPVQVSFNPTAVATAYNGSNEEELRKAIESRTGQEFTDSLEEGKHYVTFMSEVYTMDDNQLRAAMGQV